MDGKVTVYRNWFQDYDRDKITLELTEGGFVVQSIWDDLTGVPYSAAGERIWGRGEKDFLKVILARALNPFAHGSVFWRIIPKKRFG